MSHWVRLKQVICDSGELSCDWYVCTGTIGKDKDERIEEPKEDLAAKEKKKEGKKKKEKG